MIASTQTLPNLPLAANCERLVVGEWYLVPCANGIPVVGDPHTDNDHFNNTPHHYHCDSRFHDGRRGRAANCAVYANRAEITIEAMQCIRDTPAMCPISGRRLEARTSIIAVANGTTRQVTGALLSTGPAVNGRHRSKSVVSRRTSAGSTA
jgi:hypothetical protein